MPKGILEWIALGPYWTCTKNNQTEITFRSNILQKKKSARLCGYLPGNNQQHHTGSGNECHEWFSRSCRQERNALANIFIKLRRGLQKSFEVPLRKWYKRPAISAENRAKQENLELDRLLSFIAARWAVGEGVGKNLIWLLWVERPSWTP